MRKYLLFYPALLLLASCSQHTGDTPATAKTINDPAQQQLLQSFNERPVSEKISVTVNPKEEKMLRQQDGAILGLMRQMKNPAQHFIIDVSSPAKITGRQGTIISFNTKCFIDKSGNEVTKPIDVELKEVYALPDMVKENLTATSNGKLLQSKGTISITAFYKGEELKLKDGEMIRVGFPFALDRGDGYRFFYGEEHGQEVVNWNLAEEDIASRNAAQGRSVIPPQFGYNLLGLKEYMNEFITYPEDARRNELSAKVEANFRIDKNGQVTNITTNATYKTFKDEIIRVLNNMPAWTPAQYNDKSIASSLKVTIDFNLRRADQVKIETNEGDLVFYTPGRNKEQAFNMHNIPAEDVYIRSFGQMGWINCDRFLDEKGAKADVIVQANSNTDVKIILKNRNSIISGENCVGYTRFKNIPVNSEVIILSVKTEDGEISYSIQPLKLTKQNVVTPVWKKVDEEDLAKALNGIS